MTDDRKLKRAIRARMQLTGESYTTARRHVLAATDCEQDASSIEETPQSRRGPISLESLDDAITHTPRGHELLVPAADPECGPYTQFIRVPLADVDARCRAGYRRITHHEDDAMMGESEDFTRDWKHSE